MKDILTIYDFELNNVITKCFDNHSIIMKLKNDTYTLHM